MTCARVAALGVGIVGSLTVGGFTGTASATQIRPATDRPASAQPGITYGLTIWTKPYYTGNYDILPGANPGQCLNVGSYWSVKNEVGIPQRIYTGLNCTGQSATIQNHGGHPSFLFHSISG
jgi:hypothetical protein